MSIVGQSLMMIMSRAIKGRTWAENRILEQPIDPISEMLRDDVEREGKPYVAVYFESLSGEPAGLETQRGSTNVRMKVVSYIPPVTKVAEDGSDLIFQASGAGLVLNLLARQTDAALHFGNETWVKLFRKFALNVTKVTTRFLLIELENGIRIPAVDVEYDVTAIPEPEYGKPLYGSWLALDTALRDVAEDAIVADMIKRMIVEPEGLPDWQQFQMATNLTDAAYAAIGLAPLAVDDENEEVPLSDITSEPDVDIVGPGSVP